MKTIRILTFILLVFSPGWLSIYIKGQSLQYPFQDANLPVDIRVNDLVSRLTLDEKVSQLGNYAYPITRFDIPYYIYSDDAIHGIIAAGMTSFPSAIALSCTWDFDLFFNIFTAISDEARGRHNAYGNWLTYWSPVINMARDPRWGRTEETYGEDPFLTGMLARYHIKAMQGSDPKYLKTVATVKHAYCNNIEKDRYTISSDVDERSLREYYLPAFRTSVIDAKVYSILNAYNAVNGVPASADRTFLTHILREEWGFQGYTVSDCDAIRMIYDEHNYVNTIPEAVALAIRSGCEMNCGDYSQKYADSTVNLGLMSMAELDTAVKRIFKSRFLLGYFDPPDSVPYHTIPASVIDCQEHRDLALLAAKEAIVLLKNQDHILPLNKNLLSKVAVIGPLADTAQLGWYSGVPNVRITPLQGMINKLAGTGTIVNYEKGCSIKGPVDSSAFRTAVDLAGNSDVAIVICGADPTVAREDNDRTSLDMPGVQDSLIREIVNVNPNTIVVLITGFPIAIQQIKAHIPGIIVAWYDGQSQGTAIADVIMGDYNPGGRLSTTWYNSVDDLPPFDHYDIKENRTYQYFTGTPLFPFGFGLSYTSFDYSNLTLSKKILDPGDSLKVSLNIRNTGNVAGDEVPQLYIHHNSSVVKRPIKELRDFRRITLQQAESKTVVFSVAYNDLSYYDEYTRAMKVSDGTVTIMVGSSSEDIRLSDSFQTRGSIVSNTFRQDAMSRLDAENFDRKSHRISIISNDEGNQSISTTKNNDFLLFRNLDFGAGVNRFDTRIAIDSAGVRTAVLELRIDSMEGPIVGQMLMVSANDSNRYHMRTCILNYLSGVHDLYLVFKNAENGFCKMDWFVFNKDVSVKSNNLRDIRLVPNPASDQFRLLAECTDITEMTVEIYSIQGILKKRVTVKPKSRGLNIIEFNTSETGLNPGVYIVKCGIGNSVTSLKLCIIQ